MESRSNGVNISISFCDFSVFVHQVNDSFPLEVYIPLVFLPSAWECTDHMFVLGRSYHITTDVFTIPLDRSIRIAPHQILLPTYPVFTGLTAMPPLLGCLLLWAYVGSWCLPGRHCTAASSLCPQSLCPHGPLGQSHKEDSFPLHFTLLSHTGPVPWPKAASFSAITAVPHPSCLHTTWASSKSQESSHTVPQEPPCQISTRPEQCASSSSFLSLSLSEKLETPGLFLRRLRILKEDRRKERFESLFWKSV